jgi:type I restriction enzyme, S subunit
VSTKQATKDGEVSENGLTDLPPLPSGWSWAKVHEVGEVKLGRQRSPEHHHGPHMRPYLRVANVYEDRIDLSDVMEMNFTPQEYETYKLQHGDILLNEGQSLEWVGRPAMYKDDLPGACFQNTLVRFRPGSNLLPSFALLVFRYYLHSQRFQKIAKWTVNIAHLGASRFAELEFPLPPKREQARIVEKFDELSSDLDAGIATLGRVRLALKRYRATILKAAITGKFTQVWREKNDGAEKGSDLMARMLAGRRHQWEEQQLAKLAETVGKTPKRSQSAYQEPLASDTDQLPELPSSWAWTSVGVIGDVRLGRQRAPKYHHGAHMRPYLRVANVYEDRLDLKDVKEMNFTPEEFMTYELRHGDILLNEGQSLELVGRPAMYREEVPGACFQNTLVRFRSGQQVRPAFALIVFRAYLQNQRFQKIARWTVNIAHLGADRFAKMEFPLPPLAEQDWLVADVESRLSIVDKIESQVKADLIRAARLRQSIMKRAFEGRIVSQDPGDDSAKQLLNHLRSERLGQESLNPGKSKPPSSRKGSAGGDMPLFDHKGDVDDR